MLSNVVPILKWCNVVLQGTAVGCIINHLVMAYATYVWQLYVGIFFGITAFCATTLCRSMITKLVGPYEIGKVFAVNGSIQALMPFAASPTFGLLYRSTVADFPQAFLFLIIAVYLLVTVLTMIVHWLGNKAEKLRQAEEGDTNEK